MYEKAPGFPDWRSPETPPQGADADRPIMWLVASVRGLYVARTREAISGTVMGWRFSDAQQIKAPADER